MGWPACANTATGYHTAKELYGKSNGAAMMRPAFNMGRQPQNGVCGSAMTGLAETLQPTKKPTMKQTHKRPDFRQECNHPKVYRCLRAFMGAFAQSDCYCFMIDPDNDKCLFMEFSGECNRGDGLE